MNEKSSTENPISNELEIAQFFHCSYCAKSVPPGESLQSFSQLSVGWTHVGLQVWCDRHNANVIHIDFQGQKHPGNLTPNLTPSNDLLELI